MRRTTHELTARTQELLLAWELGLISDDQVVAWTDARMLEAAEPGALPSWFLELAELGPVKFAQLTERDRDFDFHSPEFDLWLAALVYRTDLSSDRSVTNFVRVLARESMGGDLKHPGVQLGYELDHLVDDCDRMDLAMARAREALPSLSDSCLALLEPLLAVAREARGGA